eukprot:COSAG06_NODE_25660_length_631_cov_1.541353_1_plen_186_part_10
MQRRVAPELQGVSPWPVRTMRLEPASSTPPPLGASEPAVLRRMSAAAESPDSPAAPARGEEAAEDWGARDIKPIDDDNEVAGEATTSTISRAKQNRTNERDADADATDNDDDGPPIERDADADAADNDDDGPPIDDLSPVDQAEAVDSEEGAAADEAASRKTMKTVSFSNDCLQQESKGQQKPSKM